MDSNAETGEIETTSFGLIGGINAKDYNKWTAVFRNYDLWSGTGRRTISIQKWLLIVIINTSHMGMKC